MTVTEQSDALKVFISNRDSSCEECGEELGRRSRSFAGIHLLGFIAASALLMVAATGCDDDAPALTAPGSPTASRTTTSTPTATPSPSPTPRSERDLLAEAACIASRGVVLTLPCCGDQQFPGQCTHDSPRPCDPLGNCQLPPLCSDDCAEEEKRPTLVCDCWPPEATVVPGCFVNEAGSDPICRRFPIRPGVGN